MEFYKEEYETLVHWILEREKIRERKEADLPKPWTNDSVLRDYKFCNVYRESDRVTKWIHKHWLHPYAEHTKIAFAMGVARILNWPDSLEIIEEHVFGEWNVENVRRDLKEYRDAGNKVFTGAYTVSTCGYAMDKIDYVCDLVFDPLHKEIRNPNQGESCEEYWRYLQRFQGFASFMAGQVVADLKFIDPLSHAKDWNGWACLGPGSIRGLNRLMRYPVDASMKQEVGLSIMRELNKEIRIDTDMKLALHNLQNCLCEMDKYCRIKEGGKVRSKYPGLK